MVRDQEKSAYRSDKMTISKWDIFFAHPLILIYWCCKPDFIGTIYCFNHDYNPYFNDDSYNLHTTLQFKKT